MFQLLVHNLENIHNVCSSDQKQSSDLGCHIPFWKKQKQKHFIYVDSAVDAEELAGLIIELFQVFSVPVEIWCDEEVRPQVYTVSIGQTYKNKGFKQIVLSQSLMTQQQICYSCCNCPVELL